MAYRDRAYRADHGGFHELANSKGIGDAMVSAAERGRRFAQLDDPDGDYAVERRTVPGGRDDEPRAGAVLESRKASAGGRRRTLVRSVPVVEGKP